MKIPKWQHKLAWYYKQGKLVSYFLNNAAKTCLYGLKISENIEIGHFFQSRTFFHLSGNLHTSCLSVFNLLPCTLFCTLILFFVYTALQYHQLHKPSNTKFMSVKKFVENCSVISSISQILDCKLNHKCSSCAIVCWIAKIYQSIAEKRLVTSSYTCNRKRSSNWPMVSFIPNGSVITTLMG